MYKILNKTLLCAALCLTAGIANAKDGAYVGVQGGYSWIQTPEIRDHKAAGGNNLVDHNRGDYAWGVNTGYETSVARNFSAGAELAYNDDGNSTITYASYNTYTISSNDIDLLLTAKYNLASSPFYIGAKAGVASVDQRYQIDKYVSGTPDQTRSNYGFRPVVDLTLGYNINKNFDLYLGYKHIFARDADRTSEAFKKTPADPVSPDVYRGISTVDTANLGLAYHF